jgi:hypothetical protein
VADGQAAGETERRKRMSKEQRKERIVARAVEEFGQWVDTL